MIEQHDPSPLEVIEQHDAHGGYELHLVGDVDLSSLPVLMPHVERVLAASPARVGFELSGVTFMDSSGIGVLLEVAHAVPDITLVTPSPDVVRLIELTGLTTVLPVSTQSVLSAAVNP